jgi:hypothetical protein
MAKRECNVTRDEFAKGARVLVADLRPHGDQERQASVMLTPKQFSTGSLGWYGNTKVSVLLDGKLVDCQVGFQVTLIGSKELPAVEAKAAA